MKIAFTRPQEGPFSKMRGIERQMCTRCHNRTSFSISTGHSLFCVECQTFGMICEDTTLYRFERIVHHHQPHYELRFSLTKKQLEASQFLINQYQKRQSAILQAVCGAGKTEMLYPLLQEVMSSGGRVCIAIPRKEIVHELAKRLQEVFTMSVVKALSSLSKDDEYAHVLISTVHQLVHYEQEFDVIIVDEADAFPYQDNPLLERFLHKAINWNGVLFKMTATISASLAKEIKSKKLPVFSLFQRFHQEPLDIPKIVPLSSANHLGAWPDILPYLKKQQAHLRQTIVFVPTRNLAALFHQSCVKAGIESEFITSETEQKERLMDRFHRQRFPLFIATSVLERGVTFANIDVFIYFADHSLWTKETLVQIAGRVGRSALFPHGTIIFFAYKKTRSLSQAIAMIQHFNRLARKKG